MAKLPGPLNDVVEVVPKLTRRNKSPIFEWRGQESLRHQRHQSDKISNRRTPYGAHHPASSGMAHLAFCLRSLISVYRRRTAELSCLTGPESGVHSTHPC